MRHLFVAVILATGCGPSVRAKPPAPPLEPGPQMTAEDLERPIAKPRAVSREQLARAGLLSPEEYAAEVNRLLGVVATTPRDKRTLAVQVARGALFATILDGRIREKSQGARSLDNLPHLGRVLHRGREGRRRHRAR